MNTVKYKGINKKVNRTQATNPYEKVDKNIYRTGKSYRVRVADLSAYCTTKKDALKRRSWMRTSVSQGKIV